jgi:hypothetical protein
MPRIKGNKYSQTQASKDFEKRALELLSDSPENQRTLNSLVMKMMIAMKMSINNFDERNRMNSRTKYYLSQLIKKGNARVVSKEIVDKDGKKRKATVYSVIE